MNTRHDPLSVSQPEGIQGVEDAPDRAGLPPRPAGAFGSAEGSPRLVIRGESSFSEVSGSSGVPRPSFAEDNQTQCDALPQPKGGTQGDAALVDYLNCSFPFRSDSDLPGWFAELFRVLGDAFGPATDRQRGLHGYKRSFSLGKSSAFFAFGGNRGTGFLSFPGEACHQVPNWPALVTYLRDTLCARLTRLDGAVDDFDGTYSIDRAVEMYKAGLFNAGGRPPVINQQGNWLAPDGRGRTLYVGQRKNGKMLRIYEKGMQLGRSDDPWVRWEVEFHNIDREIPWEAVLEPGKYVAGAYPEALGWVSDVQCRIRTLTHTANAGYDALTHWASVAYGKLIALMVEVEGSADKALERLRREGLPARLDLPPLPGVGKVRPTCER